MNGDSQLYQILDELGIQYDYHDYGRHVHLFINKNLHKSTKISFHPCINTASLVISFQELEKFLSFTGNTFEYLDLYKEQPIVHCSFFAGHHQMFVIH